MALVGRNQYTIPSKGVGRGKCAFKTYCSGPTNIDCRIKKGKFKKVVTPYQKEQCLCFVKENFPSISHSKAYNLLNCSRTKKYYTKIMPEIDKPVKQAIEASLGISQSAGVNWWLRFSVSTLK